MTKVFFDLHVGHELVRDLEGIEFEDLAVAKAEAETSLHEMVAADIQAQRPIQARSIIVRDDHGDVLATVEIRARVTMVQDTDNDRPNPDATFTTH